MELYRKGNFFLILLFLLFFLCTVLFELQFQQFISQKFLVLNNQTVPLKKAPLAPAYEFPKKLANPPEVIKAIYVTGWSAGTKKYLDYLSDLFEKTEINAVVIDIKDYSGIVSYKSGGPIKDIDSLVRFLHDKNIYVIGRVSVFEDPAYAKARPELAIHDSVGNLWRDNNGLFWLDPASKDVWEYNISVAKDVFLHGFDEVNFDYIRFPSDGNMKNISFPFWDGIKTRAEVIKEFFEYLRKELKGEKISADLFGQTTTNTDDMGIGQIIENAFENFDYVSPMVYPSHYASGFIGFASPAEHPYEIVKYSMDSAVLRKAAFASNGALAAKVRPWLQDFNMGANYTAEMVKAEIKAVEDALGENYNGFMLWNASNIYTAGAVLK